MKCLGFCFGLSSLRGIGLCPRSTAPSPGREAYSSLKSEFVPSRAPAGLPAPLSGRLAAGYHPTPCGTGGSRTASAMADPQGSALLKPRKSPGCAGRFSSCAARLRSCAMPWLSSQRGSTVPRRDDRVHRHPPRSVRGQGHLSCAQRDGMRVHHLAGLLRRNDKARLRAGCARRPAARGAQT